MKVTVFVQAKMGSSRFPGKVLALADDQPVLELLLYRLRQALHKADDSSLNSGGREHVILRNGALRVENVF